MSQWKKREDRQKRKVELWHGCKTCNAIYRIMLGEKESKETEIEGVKRIQT